MSSPVHRHRASQVPPLSSWQTGEPTAVQLRTDRGEVLALLSTAADEVTTARRAPRPKTCSVSNGNLVVCSSARAVTSAAVSLPSRSDIRLARHPPCGRRSLAPKTSAVYRQEATLARDSG